MGLLAGGVDVEAKGKIMHEEEGNASNCRWSGTGALVRAERDALTDQSDSSTKPTNLESSHAADFI